MSIAAVYHLNSNMNNVQGLPERNKWDTMTVTYLLYRKDRRIIMFKKTLLLTLTVCVLSFFDKALLYSKFNPSSPIRAEDKHAIHKNGTPSKHIEKLFKTLGVQSPKTMTELTAYVKERQWESVPRDTDSLQLIAELIPVFKNLGMIDAVKPSRKQFEFAFIVDDTRASNSKEEAKQNIQECISYLEHLINEGYTFNHIMLLAGEQSDLINSLYQSSTLPKNNYQLFTAAAVVDADGRQYDPALENMVALFRDSARAQSCQGYGMVIAVNPAITRQVKTFELVLPKTFTLYAAGPAAADNITLPTLFKELGRTISAECKLLHAQK